MCVHKKMTVFKIRCCKRISIMPAYINIPLKIITRQKRLNIYYTLFLVDLNYVLLNYVMFFG